MANDKKLEKKERIAKVALKVFANKGYQNTDINDILKEAKISKSTFYYYFKSKRELYEIIVNDFFMELIKLAWTTEYRTLNNIKEIEKYLSKLIDNYAYFSEEYKDIIKIIFTEAPSIDKDFAKNMERNIDGLLLTVVDFVSIYKEKGILKKELDANVFSYLIAGFVKEVINQVVIRENFVIDKSKLKKFILDMFQCYYVK